MRVNEETRVAESRRDAGRRGDFTAALQRAETRRGEAGRADAGRDWQRAGERLAATRGAEARGRASGAGGATPSPGAGGAGAVGATGSNQGAGRGTPGPSVALAGDQQAVRPGGSGPVGPAGETAGETAQVALAQAVRALPPVIESFRTSGQAALSLDFGGALGVELRQAPGGVEVRLSASAALQPAARAELAGLCRTLAARGVSVVSAEVRGGRPDRGRPR